MFKRLFKRTKQNEDGVTIVEMTVVIPVAAIIVVFLISILFSQYGSVLAESTRSNIRANGQALLNALQDNVAKYESVHGSIPSDNGPAGPGMPLNFGGPATEA